VEVGDVLAEIETDKTTMELTAEDAGILQEIIAGEGDNVPVGGAIAVIVGEGEEAPPRREAKQAEDGARGDGADETPAATVTEAEAPEKQEGKAPGTRKAPVAAEGPADGRVRLRPSSVAWLGNTTSIFRDPGYGPAGRIVERDVRTALETMAAPSRSARPIQRQPARRRPALPGSSSSRFPGCSGSSASGCSSPGSKCPIITHRGVHVDDLLALRKLLNAGLEEDASSSRSTISS